MDPLRNPFVPGAGTPPPELAGRKPIIDAAALALGRMRVGRYGKSLIMVGLRGVGKTVLLVRIRDLAEQDGCKAVLVEAREDKSLQALLVPPLRQILFSLDGLAAAGDKAKRALRVLAGFISSFRAKVGDVELSIEPERGVADSGDLESDLGALLVAVGEAALEAGTAVALCVDELQYLSEDELSALIMAIHQVSQRQLPLVFIGAGLPQIVGLAGRSKSYAERLFDFPEVGPLDPVAGREALQGPVGNEGAAFTEGALSEILSVTQGYPYFLQQWGHEAWNLAAHSPIDEAVVQRATVQAIERLDTSFFRVRFDRLTPREKHYLRALAELGSSAARSGDIADMLQVKVQSVAPLRGGLIRKGMIYSPAHGDTAFTVPLFDAFMKRMIPSFTPRP